MQQQEPITPLSCAGGVARAAEAAKPLAIRGAIDV
jgi:hypothetical protein